MDLYSYVVNKNKDVTCTNNTKEIYYKQPVLQLCDNNIIVSSGDITECTNHIYSTEFIDIDYNLIKNNTNNYTDIIQYFDNYRRENLTNIDIIYFIQIIDKSQRILPQQTIEIDLNNVDIAFRVSNDIIKLNPIFKKMDMFHIDLLNNKIYTIGKVNTIFHEYYRINTVLDDLSSRYDIPITFNDVYINQLTYNKYKNFNVKWFLNKFIKENILVDDKAESDIILDMNNYINIIFGE